MRVTPRLVVLEIRDRGTHISAIAVKMQTDITAAAYHIHWRAGFDRGGSDIILIRLDGVEAHCNASDWGEDPRTLFQAHQWIAKHFDDLSDGDVIDVEFVLGETKTKKISERITNG